MDSPEFVRRAEAYAAARGWTIDRQLGHGVQGTVFEAELQEGFLIAIKIHEREDAYRRERDVYLRLRELGLDELHGCHIPELIDYDDELQLLCMTMVKRPYILDFGGAFLDDPPQFSEETMAEWWAEKREQFGRRLPDVARILQSLAELGIHVLDVNANNISWPD